MKDECASICTAQCSAKQRRIAVPDRLKFVFEAPEVTLFGEKICSTLKTSMYALKEEVDIKDKSLFIDELKKRTLAHHAHQRDAKKRKYDECVSQFGLEKEERRVTMQNLLHNLQRNFRGAYKKLRTEEARRERLNVVHNVLKMAISGAGKPLPESDLDDFMADLCDLHFSTSSDEKRSYEQIEAPWYPLLGRTAQRQVNTTLKKVGFKIKNNESPIEVESLDELHGTNICVSGHNHEGK